jgi:hypothetical protein
MKVSTENDNNFWYEKITILVDNIPLNIAIQRKLHTETRKVRSSDSGSWAKEKVSTRGRKRSLTIQRER